MSGGFVDPADEQWMREHMADPPTPEVGVCFGFIDGEWLGPFRRRREATAALDRRLEELIAKGVDIVTANIKSGVVFVDPATYHLAPSKRTGTFNA